MPSPHTYMPAALQFAKLQRLVVLVSLGRSLLCSLFHAALLLTNTMGRGRSGSGSLLWSPHDLMGLSAGLPRVSF